MSEYEVSDNKGLLIIAWVGWYIAWHIVKIGLPVVIIPCVTLMGHGKFRTSIVKIHKCQKFSISWNLKETGALCEIYVYVYFTVYNNSPTM